MNISAVPAVAAPAAIVLVSVALELLLPLAAAAAAAIAGVVVAVATAPPGLAVQPVVVHRREDPQSEVELCRQQSPQRG